jgi:dTDP-D-glucose 4,6-dehydratase
VLDLVAAAIGRPLRVRTVHDRPVHDISYAMKADRLISIGWLPRIKPAEAIQLAARQLSSPSALAQLAFDE